jgi:hypothetical protein
MQWHCSTPHNNNNNNDDDNNNNKDFIARFQSRDWVFHCSATAILLIAPPKGPPTMLIVDCRETTHAAGLGIKRTSMAVSSGLKR